MDDAEYLPVLLRCATPAPWLLGAVVEARSCERFGALAAALQDDILGRYYGRLAISEARHCHDYLVLAQRYDDGSLEVQLDRFLDRDRQLIEGPDTQFRCHSGVPAVSVGGAAETLKPAGVVGEAQ
jgi:tRNA-(ms[2]io[6]A)-hydroxylase